MINGSRVERGLAVRGIGVQGQIIVIEDVPGAPARVGCIEAHVVAEVDLVAELEIVRDPVEDAVTVAIGDEKLLLKQEVQVLLKKLFIKQEQ